MVYGNKLRPSEVGAERSMVAQKKAAWRADMHREMAEEDALLRELHPEWLSDKPVPKAKPAKPAVSTRKEWKPAWMK